MSFHMPEKFRVITAGLPPGDDTCGCFSLRLRLSQMVFVVASSGLGWDHVSVSRRDRCPTWDEMCQVKDLFWDGDDCVMQLHPPKSDYINNHNFCLHIWRPTDSVIPTPPSFMVGFKDIGVLV